MCRAEPLRPDFVVVGEPAGIAVDDLNRPGVGSVAEEADEIAGHPDGGVVITVGVEISERDDVTKLISWCCIVGNVADALFDSLAEATRQADSRTAQQNRHAGVGIRDVAASIGVLERNAYQQIINPIVVDVAGSNRIAEAAAGLGTAVGTPGVD